MQERAWLRFDSLVAICALLASSIAAGAMVYQTRVIQEQFSAMVWPYLTLSNDQNNEHLALYIENQGVGPALVRSEELRVDGHVVPDWNTAVDRMFAGVARPKGSKLTFTFETLNGSTAVRAGESLRIAYIASNSPAIIAAVGAHLLALKMCYCSINARCWTVRGGGDYTGGAIPQTVNTCTSRASVGGHPFKKRL